MTRPRTLIVGLGSDFGDDRVGWIVARRLSTQQPEIATRVIGSPAELLDQLSDVDQLHIVDACQGAGPPGTILPCRWPSRELSDVAFQGSHNLGLIAALAIAAQLGLLPARVTIWGIEIDATTLELSQVAIGDEPLSPAVHAATEELVTRIACAIAAATTSTASSVCHA